MCGTSQANCSNGRRIIPTSVKIEVWNRDKSCCVVCGATDELRPITTTRRIDIQYALPYTLSMDVALTPRQESLLAEVAVRTGRAPEQILRDALDAFLEQERWFAEAVEQGREAARRGELLDHDDLVGRLEERYRS